MRRWALRISVVLCVLVVVAGGSWRVWRTWYSADQIHAAQESGDATKVCRLLRWGARADEADYLLHWAAAEGHPAVVELLLQAGADVNLLNGRGRDPLALAATWGHVETVSVLLKAEPELGTKNEALLTGIANNRNPVAITRLLLDCGANVNTKEPGTNYTALHYAPYSSNTSLVRLLLDSGAEVRVKTDKGFTPLGSAAYCGQAEMAKMLLEFGADPKARDSLGNTPLHHVARGRESAIATQIAAGREVGIARSVGHQRAPRLLDDLVSEIG